MARASAAAPETLASSSTATTNRRMSGAVPGPSGNSGANSPARARPGISSGGRVSASSIPAASGATSSAATLATSARHSASAAPRQAPGSDPVMRAV
jgi:hypothetical protein